MGGGVQVGYSWLPTTLPVLFFFFVFTPVLALQSFSSLNSLLTAEAIGYVNVDKANVMTGKEIQKSMSAKVRIASIKRSGQGSDVLPSSLENKTNTKMHLRIQTSSADFFV